MSIIHDSREIVSHIEVYCYVLERHVAQLVILLCVTSQLYAINLSLSVQVKAHLSFTLLQHLAGCGTQQLVCDVSAPSCICSGRFLLAFNS